jgi:DNA-binding FadR family transcriptional regulator
MLNDVSADQKSGVSRVEAAYQSILRLINEEKLNEGARLPSEAEMASAFGISRPVVRQALTRLQEAGVVQIRWGAGSYVRNMSERIGSAAPAFGPVNSLEEVRYTFEIRVAIESEAAALAAERATAADHDAIRAAHEKVVQVLAAQAVGQDADIDYHFAIAVASHNPFFERMMLSVRAPIIFCANLARMLAQQHAKDRARMVVTEHQAIVDAIVERDAARAREAMRLHVSNACRRVFQGLEPSAVRSSETSDKS